EFFVVRPSRGGRTWRLADMRQKRTGRLLGIEAALRDLTRDVVRDELRHLREEMLEAIRAHDGPPPKNEPNPEELLTVEQVAQLLKVIPDTVRTWIQSGALRASRPGNGTRPGRKYSSSPRGPGLFRPRIPEAARAARGRRRKRNGRDLGRDLWPRALIRRLSDRP